MIHFERLTIERKPEIDTLLHRAAHRGCAFTFANLYLWGRQCAARVGDDLLLFSHFQGKTLYPYPSAPAAPGMPSSFSSPIPRSAASPCGCPV